MEAGASEMLKPPKSGNTILKANDGDFWHFWHDLKAQFPGK